MAKSTLLVGRTIPFAICSGFESFQTFSGVYYKNIKCFPYGICIFNNKKFSNKANTSICLQKHCMQSSRKLGLAISEVKSKSIEVDSSLLQHLVATCNNPISDVISKSSNDVSLNPYHAYSLKKENGFLEIKSSLSVTHIADIPAMTLAGPRLYSTTASDTDKDASDSDKENKDNEPKTKIAQLKNIFAVYGTFAFVFHITISLISLGICYLIVSSGIDVVAILKKMGIELSTVASGASTMVIAYAVHKLILPLRASITIVSVPIVVRHLRKAGYLKK